MGLRHWVERSGQRFDGFRDPEAGDVLRSGNGRLYVITDARPGRIAGNWTIGLALMAEDSDADPDWVRSEGGVDA